MNETEVETIMRSPLVAVASDSGIRDFRVGVPHPRGYGTNARVLGRYARDRKLLTLEEAVRKMTSLPALSFRFHDRGVITAGNAADLTLFDPDTVMDKATFEEPHQYAEGIAHVIVNGTFVLRDGQMTGRLPGGPVYSANHAWSKQ
jgi:N-acyl-D-amino-acid deacylase